MINCGRKLEAKDDGRKKRNCHMGNKDVTGCNESYNINLVCEGIKQCMSTHVSLFMIRLISYALHYNKSLLRHYVTTCILLLQYGLYILEQMLL